MTNPFQLVVASSDADKDILAKEARQTNSTRSLVFSLFAILSNLVIINFFKEELHAGTPVELDWRNNVIGLNMVMICVNSLHMVAAAYIVYYKKYDNLIAAYLPYAIVFELGVWGLTGSTFHQAISWTIMPLLMTCIVSSIFIIRPRVMLIFSVLLYVALYFSLPIYQTNPSFLMIARSLGLGAVLIGLGLSVLLWNNSLLRFRQNRSLEAQTKDLKENYLQMLQFTKELQEANASKDKFFSILSHDLKSPVASSLVLTKLLEEDQLDENERKEINTLFRNSLDNISRLIHDVLLWANSQTGTLRFEPSELSLHKVIEETILGIRPLALQKNIAVANEVPTNLVVHADKNMLDTILRNLLVNAVKFTHEKGEVVVSATKRASGQLEICVQDNGVGISPRLLNDLFKIDKKIMSLGTNNESGTGLGLILCKDFVEKHKGTLSVESTEGKGSRFIIVLP